MIDKHALTFAARGHVERLTINEHRPMEQLMLELGVDPEELRALAQVLRDLRRAGDNPMYAPAFTDGFVIGVRAAREASRIEAA